MSIVELDPKDLEITTFDSKQRGGFSFREPKGIKVLHKPTGITVEEESHRNQHNNRELALNKLCELISVFHRNPVVPVALEQSTPTEWVDGFPPRYEVIEFKYRAHDKYYATGVFIDKHKGMAIIYDDNEDLPARIPKEFIRQINLERSAVVKNAYKELQPFSMTKSQLIPLLESLYEAGLLIMPKELTE